MVDVLATFWWQNRDRLPALQEQLEAAVAEIGRLQSALDPEAQRRQAIDQVWKMAFTLHLAGHPLSLENLFYYIQVAEATATHSPIPHPPSYVPVVASREDAAAATPRPHAPLGGLTMWTSESQPLGDRAA